MKLITTLAIGALSASFAFANPVFLDASDYNVFVREGFSGQNSDVQGRVAVGGTFNVQNYSIGSGLSAFNGVSLMSGGDFTYNNGQVFHGNVTTSDNTPTTPGMNVVEGSLYSNTAPTIVIPELMTELVARSGYIGSQAATGTTDYSFGSLTLSGGSGDTRYFDVTASQLASTTNFVINAPSNATVVVNVNGANASFQNAGYSLTGGIDASHVLLNFWNATSLTLAGVGVSGSVFAPQADVTFNNGQLNGQLVAHSFNGSGEMHIADFTGIVPVPEPAALSVVAVGLIGLFLRRRK
ncbi:MAG: choice-of-anchor A family protein [Armatimonadetes bacterium]|nr:choice-of-anchor A family protein [Armatimonadota bacterium]